MLIYLFEALSSQTVQGYLFAWMRIEGQRGIYESVVLGIFFVLDLYDGLVKKIQIVVTNYYFVL